MRATQTPRDLRCECRQPLVFEGYTDWHQCKFVCYNQECAHHRKVFVAPETHIELVQIPAAEHVGNPFLDPNHIGSVFILP